MKKIISLFQRNYDGDRLVRDEIVPGSEWVIHGQGVATRKWDGTSCLFQDGKWFKRYDAKNGKTPPPGFVPAQEADPVTGHWPGWVPVNDSDKWHKEAIDRGCAITGECPSASGSTSVEVPFKDRQPYELCGPKIQSNPEGAVRHLLIEHGALVLPDFPRSFSGLRCTFESLDIEGVVWHHSDGRMVKIKKKDFGFKR